jgi:hypothetical protein
VRLSCGENGVVEAGPVTVSRLRHRCQHFTRADRPSAIRLHGWFHPVRARAWEHRVPGIAGATKDLASFFGHCCEPILPDHSAHLVRRLIWKGLLSKRLRTWLSLESSRLRFWAQSNSPAKSPTTQTINSNRISADTARKSWAACLGPAAYSGTGTATQFFPSSEPWNSISYRPRVMMPKRPYRLAIRKGSSAATGAVGSGRENIQINCAVVA